jgi:transposase
MKKLTVRDAAYALLTTDSTVYVMLKDGRLKGHLAAKCDSQKAPSWVSRASLKAAIERRKGVDAVSHAERVRRLNNLE